MLELILLYDHYALEILILYDLYALLVLNVYGSCVLWIWIFIRSYYINNNEHMFVDVNTIFAFVLWMVGFEFIWLLCIMDMSYVIWLVYVMGSESIWHLYTMEWWSNTMNFYILWYFLYENWYICIWWFLHIQANMCWSAAMVFFMDVPTNW